MKKIALLTDGWKRFLIYSWVDGIMGQARILGEDVCLYHYNCYGNWSHDSRHNQGEYNIFTLPDLSSFDGIVLDCNNITDEKQLHSLIELVKKSGVPVVSINYDSEGFYYVGINNRKPISEIMEHLYQEHGCRSFLFAGGPIENYENSVRVDTFLEAINKFGLKREDNPVWYRDYDFDSGVYYMEKLVAEGGCFPDAIVCANDNIAAGLCTEAQRLGYEIPRDFLVTGFDNLDKAMYFQPQISTVHHHRGEIGIKSLEILLQVFAGEKLNKYHLIDTECIFSESCGCPNSKVLDYRAYMKGMITYSVSKDKEDVKLVDLEAEMALCDSFEEIFYKVGEFLQGCDCDGFYVVVDKFLLDAKAEGKFAVKGYKYSDMELLYANNFTEEVGVICCKEEMEVYMEEYGCGCHFLHTPIHFSDQTVGYSVLKNGRFLYSNSGYFYSVHSAMTKAMENLYRRRQIEKVNQELRDIYNRDQLTGLFNRIAYNERMEPEFEEYNRFDISCAILFIDVNKFKEINDTFGHKYGDEVLKKVAEVIQEHCPADGYCYRYGGDEFVMFLPNVTYEEAVCLRNTMKESANKTSVGISVGIAVTNPAEKKALHAYVEIADEDMYRDKMQGR